MTSLWRCLWLYCHEFFFTSSPWYYLTSCQNLLRLNVIFIVREIGELLLNEGWLPPPPPSTLPLSNFRAKTVGPIWKIFSWTDVPRMSLQVKSSSHFWEKVEKWKNLFGGDIHTPPPPGHRRVKYLHFVVTCCFLPLCQRGIHPRKVRGM